MKSILFQLSPNEKQITLSSSLHDPLKVKPDNGSDDNKLEEPEPLKLSTGAFSPSAALYKDYFPALRPTRLMPPPLWSTLRDCVTEKNGKVVVLGPGMTRGTLQWGNTRMDILDFEL
ncbi:homeobox domain-containing protein [Trichonephila inaurata madagascariensis]|uniref:Homeobox domain-containing protein n=1 Tax=Trichonephila inaurata madagascariensis TaxID=2747483 RepID=A0A8X6WTA1_9ARAC|nr:homeobox domain-containing protein [Trichonephila inaurata madagascariensis]